MSIGTLDLESVIDSLRVTRFQIAIVTLCMMVAMVDGFDTQAIALAAPEIAAAWQAPPAAFGLVFGAGLLGGLLGAMMFGTAGDSYGRKPALLAAVLLFSLVSLLTPFAASIPGLLLIRLVTGLGLGGALPCIISITSEYAPRRLRATLVSLMFCGFPLGAVVGGVAAARMIPAWGWPSLFFAGSAIPLLLLPLLARGVPESARFLALRGREEAVVRILARMQCAELWNGRLGGAPAESRSPVASLFSGGRRAGTLLLWVTLFLSLLLTYFLINWIPILARQSGIGIQTAVLAVSALNLGAIGGCLAIGRLVDRYGPALPIAAGFACGAVAIALIGASDGAGGLLLGLALLAGLFSIGAQMCTIALCSSFYETSLRATGVGWAIGVGRIGAVVGPVLGGVLLSSGVPVQSLFFLVGAMSAAAAIAMLAMGRLALRPAASAEEGASC
ncbi:MAG TPA: MFS transporter [Magnetospirillaceae bacterium]|nr:MFS transporter [Magnetospirillaceae bacterium]